VSEDFTGLLRRVLDGLDNDRAAATRDIDVRKAQATVTADRDSILAAIESEDGGCTALTAAARVVASDCILQWQAAALGSWAAARQSSRWESAAAALRASSSGGSVGPLSLGGAAQSAP
jgi:hypothetical protein